MRINVQWTSNSNDVDRMIDHSDLSCNISKFDHIDPKSL